MRRRVLRHYNCVVGAGKTEFMKSLKNRVCPSTCAGANQESLQVPMLKPRRSANLVSTLVWRRGCGKRLRGVRGPVADTYGTSAFFLWKRLRSL